MVVHHLTDLCEEKVRCSLCAIIREFYMQIPAVSTVYKIWRFSPFLVKIVSVFGLL